MKPCITLMLFLLTYCTATQAQNWSPKGARVNGVSAYGYAGSAVAMPDANTLAVAAPGTAASGIDSGHIRIYTWNGSTWVQKGSTLTGVNYRDEFGHDITMPDANTVAVSAPFNDDAFNNAGQVKVFTWNGTDWVQKGANINGLNSSYTLGYSIVMPDANTLAIGAQTDGTGGNYAGSASIYTWNGTAWVLKGAAINGAAGDYSGFDINMPDANTIAISAPYNDDVANNSGAVKVYSWSGSAWQQKGTALLGDTAYDQIAFSVDMADANTIVVASVFGVVNSQTMGKAKVYTWSGSAWIQKGTTIPGLAPNAGLGEAVSMPDANTLAVSATNGGPGDARVFNWDGSAWVQTANTLTGVNNDRLGYSLFMPNANTIAVGVPFNEDAGAGYGYVQVWQLSGGTGCTNTSGSLTASACQSYTSPSGKTYSISGVYTDTIPNAAGCDSIITINLTVSNLTAIVDTTSSPTFVAQPANALSYVWKRCSDSVTVQTGAANTFTATENGTYFVTITDTLNCADASVCFEVTEIVGIPGTEALTGIEVYPNPASHILNLRFADNATYGITIINVQGKAVFTSVANNYMQINTANFAKGVYMLQLSANGQTTQQKLVIK